MEEFLLKVARIAFYGMICFILFLFGPLPALECWYGYDPDVDDTITITGKHRCLRMFPDMSLQDWRQRPAAKRNAKKIAKARNDFLAEGEAIDAALAEAIAESKVRHYGWYQDTSWRVNYYQRKKDDYERRFKERYGHWMYNERPKAQR